MRGCRIHVMLAGANPASPTHTHTTCTHLGACVDCLDLLVQVAQVLDHERHHIVRVPVMADKRGRDRGKSNRT